MATKTKLDIEFSQRAREKTDEELVKFLQEDFKRAKDQRREREKVIENNVEEIKKLENNIDTSNVSGRLGINFPQKEYVSPLLILVLQEMVSSDWIPNINFEPEERFGEGADIFLARNSNNIHNFILDNGDFYKEALKGAVDLFSKGRMHLRKEFVTLIREDGKKRKFQMPSYLKWKHIPWERVYQVFDGGGIFIRNEHTREELLDTYGDDIRKKPIRLGAPFEGVTNELVDFDKEKISEKENKIISYEYYNGKRKIHAVVIGGSAFVHKKEIEDKWPKAWIGKNNEGFNPIDSFDGGIIPFGNHPICSIDLIVKSWKSHSTMMNATISRAIRAANPPMVVGSKMNPKAAKRQWMQAEVDRIQTGVDIPMFMKTDGQSNAFSVDVMDVGVNNTNVQIWRDIFLDEIMIATGINLRALGQGAPTAEQERLRVKRELDTVTKIIRLNEPNWQRFALTNMYMLKNVESEFLEKFITIEDEISDETGEGEEGIIRDIFENMGEEFEFNVRVSINNSNARRKDIEVLQKQESLQTLAQVFGPVPAVTEMAKDIASDQFPNLSFTPEQFQQQPPPEEAVPEGAPTAEEIPPLV